LGGSPGILAKCGEDCVFRIIINVRDKSIKKMDMEAIEIITKVISALATILVPILVVWMGNKLSNTFKEKEIRLKYIEMAIDVLKEKPEDKDLDMRQWAIDVLSEYSEIELPKTVQNRLLKEQPLPSDRLFESQKNFYEKQFK